MGKGQAGSARCQWCGKTMPEEAEACPHCGRAEVSEELRPLGGEPGARAEEMAAAMRGREEAGAGSMGEAGERKDGRRAPPDALDREYRVEPMAPSEGQEEPWSIEYVRSVVRADRVFGVVLGILGAGALLFLLMGSWGAAFMVGVMLWGVLTLQRWGYLMAVGTAGVFAVVLAVCVVAALLAGKQQVAFSVAYFSVLLGINVFVLAVLLTRRDHFW